MSECIPCQKCNMSRCGRLPLCSLPVIGEPFSVVAADIVGPCPRTKRRHCYILTIMDLESKYPEPVPLAKADAYSVVEGLFYFFYKFRFPDKLLTDTGSNFTGKVMNGGVCK